MITQEQREFFQTIDVTMIINLVDNWSKENVPNEYYYNSRAAYWGSALRSQIITQDEYNLGRSHYRNLWDYVGD